MVSDYGYDNIHTKSTLFVTAYVVNPDNDTDDQELKKVNYAFGTEVVRLVSSQFHLPEMLASPCQ